MVNNPPLTGELEKFTGKGDRIRFPANVKGEGGAVQNRNNQGLQRLGRHYSPPLYKIVSAEPSSALLGFLCATPRQPGNGERDFNRAVLWKGILLAQHAHQLQQGMQQGLISIAL